MGVQDPRDGIGVLFHVKGGVKGESAEQIKSELEAIAAGISKELTVTPKIKIVIDSQDFSAELEKLKLKIDKTFGSIKLGMAPAGEKKTGEKELKKEVSSVSELSEKYQKAQEALNKYKAAAIKVAKEVNGNTSTAATQIAQQTEFETKFENALKELQKTDGSGDYGEKLKKENGALAQQLTYITALTEAKREDQTNKNLSTGFKSLQANAQGLIERYSKIIHSNKKAAVMAAELQKAASDVYHGGKWVDDDGKEHEGGYNDAKAQIDSFKELNKVASETFAKVSAESDTFGNEILEKFTSNVAGGIAAALSGLVTRAISQVYQNVVRLDAALVDLQIATGYTRKETAKLMDTYAALGQQLGASLIDVSAAADTWLRQGYDIEETNELITDSMMLSKLGQLDAAAASTALTSAIKGYKVEIADASKIVDKFTAVDMAAAASAGDIATAMAETAVGASVAGVDMDKLIGYITTVKEVTQDGAESVGQFYKTLFARMGNVKAGKFVDDETGESLNDVESVVKSLGISLRDTSGDFRNFDEVLDEVAASWESYNSVQQHALATAFAGTRQSEKFFTLMENYGTALEYATISAESAGTAAEKYQDYLDGIGAKLQTLNNAWQEFSKNVLDSELIKLGVDFLTGIAKALNWLAKQWDGILVTIPAATAALVVLAGLFKQIAASTLFINITAAAKSLFSFIPAVATAVGNLVKKIQMLQVMAATGGRGVGELTSTLQEIPKITVPSKIMLIVTAITVLIKVIKWLREAQQRASDKAKEAAENAKEVADTAKEEQESLRELTSQYQELAKSGNINEENREKIRQLQKKINVLVGDERHELDLINDSLDLSIQKLRKIARDQAVAKQADYTASYSAASRSSQEAYAQDNAGLSEGQKFLADIDFTTAGYEIGVAQDAAARQILEGIEGVDINGGFIEQLGVKMKQLQDPQKYASDASDYDKYIESEGSPFFTISFEGNGAQNKIDVIEAAIKALEEDEDYAHWDSDVYSALVRERASYREFAESQRAAALSSLENVAFIAGVDAYDSIIVNSIETYEQFKQKIIETVRSSDDLTAAFADGAITQDDLTAAADEFMALNFPDYYNQIAKEAQKAVIAAESFLSILEKYEKSYDALSKALDDIEEQGIVSADAISEILKTYPELEKFFKLTNQGYKLAAQYQGMDSLDLLQMFATENLQTYVDKLAMCEEGTDECATAQENLNNAIAVWATLLRSKAIEEETKKLNEQKEALEEQVDKTKDLIDVRKDLLETYQEEIEYQKELAKKQKNVADLQTQLALAKLDRSASGQARARELEDELKEAQEELDEFTLDKAIDVLLADIDSQYDDYKAFIDSEIARIEEAIKNIAQNIHVEVNVPQATVSKKETQSTTAPTSTTTPIKKNGTYSNILLNNVAPNHIKMWAQIAESDIGSGTGSTLTDRTNEKAEAAAAKKAKAKQIVLDMANLMSRAIIRPTYHTGGLVGGEATLESNEEFAKLLKGEFVSTPAQMDRFIKKTMPSIVSQTSGGITYNAPLVEIKCDNISQDALPKLNEIIDGAVDKIKKDMSSALGRTGYRKQY